MEELVTQLIQSQGIWAVLFVFLLLYTANFACELH